MGSRKPDSDVGQIQVHKVPTDTAVDPVAAYSPEVVETAKKNIVPMDASVVEVERTHNSEDDLNAHSVEVKKTNESSHERDKSVKIEEKKENRNLSEKLPKDNENNEYFFKETGRIDRNISTISSEDTVEEDSYWLEETNISGEKSSSKDGDLSGDCVFATDDSILSTEKLLSQNLSGSKFETMFDCPATLSGSLEAMKQADRICSAIFRSVSIADHDEDKNPNNKDDEAKTEPSGGNCNDDLLDSLANVAADGDFSPLRRHEIISSIFPCADRGTDDENSGDFDAHSVSKEYSPAEEDPALNNLSENEILSTQELLSSNLAAIERANKLISDFTGEIGDGERHASLDWGFTDTAALKNTDLSQDLFEYYLAEKDRGLLPTPDMYSIPTSSKRMTGHFEPFNTMEFSEPELDVLEIKVHTSDEARLKNIESVVEYGKSYQYRAKSLLLLFEVFQTACNLALKYLPFEDAVKIFQQCGDVVYNLSLNIGFYPSLRHKITEKAMIKLESLRNSILELHNDKNQITIELNVTYLLAMSAFQRVGGFVINCENYLNEAMDLCEKNYQVIHYKSLNYGEACFHMARFQEDVGNDELCTLYTKHCFDSFSKADDSLESSISSLYSLVASIGYGTLTSSEDYFQKAENFQTFTLPFKKKVFEKLLARSHSSIHENEVMPNLLALIWFAKQLSEDQEVWKVQDFEEIDLVIPSSPKICESLMLLSIGVLYCGSLAHDPRLKYKLANFAFELVLILSPEEKKVQSLGFLIKAVMGSERTHHAFEEDTIPFLLTCITCMEDAETEDWLARKKYVCDSYLYLCLCYAELEDYDNCLETADEALDLLDTCHWTTDTNLILSSALAYYVRAFACYKTGNFVEAFELIGEQINYLQSKGLEQSLVMQTAISHFTFFNQLKCEYLSVETPALFERLFAFHKHAVLL